MSNITIDTLKGQLEYAMKYYGFKKWEIAQIHDRYNSLLLSVVLPLTVEYKSMDTALREIFSEFTESDFIKELIAEKDKERLELETKLNSEIEDLKREIIELKPFKNYYDLAHKMQHGHSVQVVD